MKLFNLKRAPSLGAQSLAGVAASFGVGVGLLATMSAAQAQMPGPGLLPGSWQLQWTKAGSREGNGVVNYYNTYPTLDRQVPRQVKEAWNQTENMMAPFAGYGSFGVGDANANWTHGAGSDKLSGSYAMKLVWVSGTSNAPAPTKVYVLDYLVAQSYVEFSEPQGTITNYSSEVSNGIDSPITLENNRYHPSHDKRSAGWVVRCINNEQRQTTVPLETYKVSSSLSFSLDSPQPPRNQALTFSSTGRVVSPVSFSLQVRPHIAPAEGGAIPIIENGQSSATIAAGGKESDEHVVDVQVTLNRPASAPVSFSLADIPLDFTPEILYGNGEEADAIFTPVENPKTDEQGRAIIGTLTSSDKTTGETPGRYRRLLIKLPLGLGTGDPTAIVNQDWATFEWKMGENGDKPWGTRFLLLGDSYTEWAWIKAQSADNKPLKGHTMKLIVDRLQVSQTNSETGAVQTTLYTTDKTEAEQHENNGDGSDTSFVVVYKKDLTSDVSAFVSLPDEISDSGAGVYKGEFTIHKVEGATIDKLKLAIEDQGVFRSVS